MDFMRILRSLEEFLYEAMTWLVFYPRTLLRTAFHPIRVLEYSRAELNKPEEEQYQDSLSAPLFLMLTLMISHGFEMALHLHPFDKAGEAAGKLLNSGQNLIIVRSLMFAVLPLMFALQQVEDSKQVLTRKTLRGPFFGECYPASVFCLMFGIGGTILHASPEHALIGGLIMAGASLWYLAVQIIWLKRFNTTWTRSTLIATGCFLKATVVALVVASAFALALLD